MTFKEAIGLSIIVILLGSMIIVSTMAAAEKFEKETNIERTKEIVYGVATNSIKDSFGTPLRITDTLVTSAGPDREFDTLDDFSWAVGQLKTEEIQP